MRYKQFTGNEVTQPVASEQCDRYYFGRLHHDDVPARAWCPLVSLISLICREALLRAVTSTPRCCSRIGARRLGATSYRVLR